MTKQNYQKREVSRVFSAHESRKLSRREVIVELRNIGLGAAATSALLSAHPFGVGQAMAAASSVEERALNSAKLLSKSATKTSITIMHPSGSAGNMAPFISEWKAATGLDIELIEAPLTEMHSKGMQEAVAKTGQFDLILPSPFSLPDFAEAGIAADITGYVEKHDPEIDHGESRIPYPTSEFGCKYRGRYYGIFTDGDQWTLYMRKDLMEDTENRAAFKKKHGRDLAAPNTWEEYDQTLAFFTRPAENLWGGLEYRSPFYAKWQWMMRFCSKGKVYFDENMDPLCNSPEGVATVEELVAIEPYLPREAFTNGWSENYSQFGKGQAFSTFGWPSFYRYNNDSKISPAVSGKILNAPVPGSVVNGDILRAAILPFAWSFVVNAHGSNQELAYLCAQWLTGPMMSMRAIPQKGGYFDPFRKNHFLTPSPEMSAAYSGNWLDAAWANFGNICPEFCLRGTFEYADALDRNLIDALVGKKTAKEAMDGAANEMRRITRRLGRDRQIDGWRSLARTFPTHIKSASGVDQWS